MRLREKFERKHVHSWKLIRDSKDLITNTRLVTRECDDPECRVRAKALIESYHDAYQTPDSLIHLADAEWRIV